MTTNIYGTDIAVVWTSTGPDLDLSRQSTGIYVLAQSLMCRLSTPHGSVVDAPNDCLDLRELVGAGITQNDMQTIQQRVKRECERDARVLQATVGAAYNQATKSLTLTLNIVSSAGTFSMTLVVSAVTVQLIQLQLIQQSAK